MLQALRTRPIISLLIVFFFILLVQTSWIGDDAYITMRTVDNFVHGNGLRWNIDERVQSYTHPLWMFLLSGVYALIGDSALTLFGLSIFVSTSAVLLLLVTVPKNNFGVLLAWVSLVLSKAFVDYSNSGLENPATHLLLLIFTLLFLQEEPQTPRRIFLLSLVAGFSVFNRLDTVLFYIPALLHILWTNRTRRTLSLILAGMTPILLWEVFSLVYYGFFVPNTYYAKLTSGIPANELLLQGITYYINAISWNPVTLIVIIASILIGIFSGNKSERWLAVGSLFYLAYIVLIGGDFMSGRFFSAPLFLGVILLVRHVQERSMLEKSICLMVVLAFGTILSPVTSIPLRSTPPYVKTGIADEAAGYYMFSNLMLFTHETQIPIHPWANMGRDMRAQGLKVIEVKGIGPGMYGFFLGPEPYLVDPLALCDPLLARLPMRPDKNWRIGHYERDLPPGYLDTLKSGQNQIQDPDLATYYEKLQLVIRGDIWSKERWQAIWGFNTGQYTPLLANYVSTLDKP